MLWLAKVLKISMEEWCGPCTKGPARSSIKKKVEEGGGEGENGEGSLPSQSPCPDAKF